MGADRTKLHNSHGPFLRLRLLLRRRRVTKYELKRNVNTNHCSSDIYFNRFYFLFSGCSIVFKKINSKLFSLTGVRIENGTKQIDLVGYRFLIVPRKAFSPSVAESE